MVQVVYNYMLQVVYILHMVQVLQPTCGRQGCPWAPSESCGSARSLPYTACAAAGPGKASARTCRRRRSGGREGECVGPVTALSTIIRDDWFRADTSHFPLYFVTSFVWGGSEQNDFFLVLQDWVRAEQISAGAGRLMYFNMSAAEWQSKAWGD